MRSNALLLTTGLAATAQAACPSVWSTVASDLKNNMFSSCNDDARAAIRLPFHDCFAGACDGSILLSDECDTRQENIQLQSICRSLGSKVTEYGVGAGDLIQVAAGELTSPSPIYTPAPILTWCLNSLALAVDKCTPGPVLTVRVGRKDSSSPNPEAMPNPSSSASELVALFQSKGLSSRDLVALVGAHSAGKNLRGQSFDSTPDNLDVGYYDDVLTGRAPTAIQSDINLSKSGATRAAWTAFGVDQSSWNNDFAVA